MGRKPILNILMCRLLFETPVLRPAGDLWERGLQRSTELFYLRAKDAKGISPPIHGHNWFRTAPRGICATVVVFPL